MAQASTVDPAAFAARKKLLSRFRTKGLMTALFGGFFSGIYTGFITLAMTLGIWGVWYGKESGLYEFAVLYLLCALGAATSDACSALWALGAIWRKGKFGDFARCIQTGPGLVMAGAAFIGGPLANTSYVVGLQMAGSLVVPVSALSPAIGAILGRVLFKQPLNARMILGILLCFSAAALIGGAGIGESAPRMLLPGLFFGFLTALGWGIEGCICGYGTSMIDPEIGITIRQTTSGLSNLLILVPLFSLMASVNPLKMITLSFSDSAAMPWFLVAGLCAYLGFMLWYKGNSMCGAALGMACCDGTFAFWGPFFCWLILGVILGIPGWGMPPIAWFAALLMFAGIFIIAVNPLNLLDDFRENR